MDGQKAPYDVDPEFNLAIFGVRALGAALFVSILYLLLRQVPLIITFELSEKEEASKPEEKPVEAPPKKSSKKPKKTQEQSKKEEAKKEEPQVKASKQQAKKEQPKKTKKEEAKKEEPKKAPAPEPEPFISKSQMVDLDFQEVKQRVKKEPTGEKRKNDDSDTEYDTDDEFWGDSKKGGEAKKKQSVKVGKVESKQQKKSDSLKAKKDDVKKEPKITSSPPQHRPPTTAFDLDEAKEAESEYADEDVVIDDEEAEDLVLEQNSYQQAKAEAAEAMKQSAKSAKNKAKKERKKANKAGASVAASAIVEKTAPKPEVKKNLTASANVDEFVTVNKREKVQAKPKRPVVDSSDEGESELSMD